MAAAKKVRLVANSDILFHDGAFKDIIYGPGDEFECLPIEAEHFVRTGAASLPGDVEEEVTENTPPPPPTK